VSPPFLVRTCAEDSFLAAPIADILGSFAWHGAVVLVHEEYPHVGAGIIPALVDAGTSIAGRAAVPVGASDGRLDAVLYRVMSKTTARVFVVHMSPSLARRVFRRSKKAGMMSQGYVWIATAGLGDDDDRDRLSADDIDAMRGVVIVRFGSRRGSVIRRSLDHRRSLLTQPCQCSERTTRHGPLLPQPRWQGTKRRVGSPEKHF